MNTLCIEGAKNNILINCLAPTAATRMTEDIMNEDAISALNPQKVTPAAMFLVSDCAPNRTIMMAGAGVFSTLEIRESEGIFIPEEHCNAEGVANKFAEISDMSNASVFTNGNEHITKILSMRK